MTREVDIMMSPSRMLAVARFHIDVAELDRVDPDKKSAMGRMLGAAFGTVAMHLGRLGVAPQGPPVACYKRAGDGFDVAAGFPVTDPFNPGDGVELFDLAAVVVAHTTHIGPYDQVPSVYAAMHAGAEAQGRTLDDDAAMWEEYLSAPGTPPEQNRTEVYWPLVAI